MRLIDADELKKSLNFVYDCAYIGSKSKEGIASDIIDEIDNAPTVPQPDFKAGYKQAIIDGKTNFSRLQGEWINTSPYDTEGECSVCCYLSNKCYNFCPNCGARMRGKEE